MMTVEELSEGDWANRRFDLETQVRGDSKTLVAWLQLPLGSRRQAYALDLQSMIEDPPVRGWRRRAE